MSARPAIVSTVRDAGDVLDSFVRYHLAIGFELLFLFFDDPDDPFIQRLAGEPRVVAIPHDDALRKQWRDLRSWPKMGDHLDAEVMARQHLNCELAIGLARNAGCDWILHIDSDEAFCCGSIDAGQLFGQLSEGGVDTAVFLNFEAMPESEEVGDFFREVTLFKVNPLLQGRPRFNPRQVELIRRSHFAGPTLMNFNLYSNGKSAGKIDDYLLPLDVHRFTRQGPEGTVESNAVMCGDNAIILHYPNCGFRNFLTKYRTLGDFGDKWFGVTDIIPFHGTARDVCASGDESAARKFYQEHVMRHPNEDVGLLLQNGILARISFPADILQSG